MEAATYSPRSYKPMRALTAFRGGAGGCGRCAAARGD